MLAEAIYHKVEWTKQSPDSLISQTDYTRGLITAVVWILQQYCELQVDLHYSTSRESIFCLLTATEEQLRQRAAFVEYRLQMKQGGKKDYMKVPPYIDFLAGVTKIDELKVYDDKSAPGRKSLFSLKDKTRLVYGLVSESLSLNQLHSLEALKTHYCAHQHESLRELFNSWASFRRLFTPQPMNEIRRYFGEQVAMYFAWIGYYCWTMVWVAVAGIIIYIVDFFWEDKQEAHETLSVVNSLFLSLWATLLDQIWLRREKKLAWQWGTIGYTEIEEQREAFKGEYVIDPFTLKRVKAREGYWRVMRQALSFSVAAVFIMMVIIAVMGLFIYRAILLREKDENGVLYCALLNAVQIRIMNIVYSLVARKMNDWENHETETDYLDSLSVKLFLFRFVNCYVSFFYIAFFKEHYEKCDNNDCDGELAVQLGIVFLMNISLNIVELGWPLADYAIRVWLENRSLRRSDGSAYQYQKELGYTERQEKLDPYETPMEDYMEMVCQYGYIVMFSSVLPLVGVLALLEILVEVRVDALKLCVLMQRPYPHKCESIGVWTSIVQLVSLMGIITNSALIMFSSHRPQLVPGGDWENFLALESMLLVLKRLVPVIISDRSTVVKHGILWSKRISSEQRFVKKQDFLSEMKYSFMRKIKRSQSITALQVAERESVS